MRVTDKLSWLSVIFERTDLSANAKVVLFSLVERADRNLSCFPSITRMGKDAGFSRATAGRGLKELVDSGLVIRHPRRLETGENTSSEYFLNPKESDWTGRLRVETTPSQDRDDPCLIGETTPRLNPETLIPPNGTHTTEPTTEPQDISPNQPTAPLGISKEQQTGRTKTKPATKYQHQRKNGVPWQGRQKFDTPIREVAKSPEEILGTGNPAKFIRDVGELGYEVARPDNAAKALAELKPDNQLLDVMWNDLRLRIPVWKKTKESPQTWPSLETYIRTRMWEQKLPKTGAVT